MPADPNSVWTAPNLLSLSRVPLAAAVFACVAHHLWAAALAVFAVAALTDWADGWLARRWNLTSAVGRALDPLTDKILVCGAFVYLLPVGDTPDTGLRPWMVTVVVGRELLVTGVRGIVEAGGKKFGADWFGKLKTVLQIAAILGVLSAQAARAAGHDAGVLGAAAVAALYAAVAATVGSGVQYLVKAARLLG